MKATQQSATHAQTGCCTSFSSHGAGTRSITAFIGTASGIFLRRQGCLVFYRHVTLVACNCLILVSERVSGFTRLFPITKIFYIMFSALFVSLESSRGLTSLSFTCLFVSLHVSGQGTQSLCSDRCHWMLFWMLQLLSVLPRRVKFLLCCKEMMIWGYHLQQETTAH